MAEVIIAEVNGEASLVRGETGEQVNVTVGMTVAEGDVLIILESMKMEIPVESPVSGSVQEVMVQPEDQVEEDQLLLVIEA